TPLLSKHPLHPSSLFSPVAAAYVDPPFAGAAMAAMPTDLEPTRVCRAIASGSPAKPVDERVKEVSELWRRHLRHAAPEIEASPHFPSLGETCGDFALLDELGHGAEGRVYLARQRTLAHRPVVLKVTGCGGEEHF